MTEPLTVMAVEKVEPYCPSCGRAIAMFEATPANTQRATRLRTVPCECGVEVMCRFWAVVPLEFPL